jgi:UDP-N-acetylglucosamine transferase subunit ALG13
LKAEEVILYLYIGSGFYIDVLNFVLSDELHEIKQYLQIKYKQQFGRASLQKVTNCVELMRLLQDRDLLGINKLSFIKTLLDHMKRNDLLRAMNNYEKESVEAVDAKSRRPKSGN